MDRWKFIWILLSVFLILETVDILSTYYGVKKLGLQEDNPHAIELMQVKGFEGGLFSMLMDNVGLVLLLVVLSNWKIGPLLAVVLLGSFSFQFFPTVINNLAWIYFDVGLYYEELLIWNALAYMIGAITTLFYLNSIGDLDLLTEYLKNVTKDFQVLSMFFDFDD